MWNALRNKPAVNKAYYYKWYDYATNRMPELIDFCQEYYDFAHRSLEHNNDASISNQDYEDYARLTAYAQSWLKKRADYVLKSIKSYPLPETPVEPEPTYETYSGQIFGSLGTGSVVGIDALATSQPQDLSTSTYDLQGRRVTKNTTGVTVTATRKTAR